MVQIEGEERYGKLQQFFSAVHRLTSERRLSRFVYVARKPEAEPDPGADSERSR
jgi:hypothetical protein